MKRILLLLLALSLSDGLFAQFLPIKTNNLFGVIDHKGTVLAKPNFQAVAISDKHFALKSENKWDVMNAKGEKISTTRYDDAFNAEFGFMLLSFQQKKAVVWANGQVSLPEFDMIKPISKQLIKLTKDNLVTLCDENGKKLIATEKGDIFMPDSLHAVRSSLFFNKEGDNLQLFSSEKLLFDKVESYVLLSNGYLLFKKSGLWGCVSNLGKLVAEAKYTSKGFIEPAFVAFSENNKWGLFSMIEDKWVVKTEYDFFEIMQDFYGLGAWHFKVRKEKMFGVIDEHGKNILPFQYDNVHAIGKSWFIAKKAGKWGLVSKKNVTVLPFEYDNFSDFEERLPLAKIKKGKNEGLINAEGKIIVPLLYDLIEVLPPNIILAYQGQAITRYDLSDKMTVLKERKYHDFNETGLTNRDLNNQIYFKSNNTDNMSNLRWVKKSNGKVILSNQTQTNVLKIEFDFAFTDPFVNLALAKIYEDKKRVKTSYLIDATGGKILFGAAIQDFELSDFRENDIARIVRDSTEQYKGFITKAGKIMDKFGDKQLKADSISDFYEGLIWVRAGGKYGFLNSKGENIIPFNYDFATNFFEGMAKVKQNNLYGCLNKEGKIVIPIEYSEISPLTNGFYTAIKSGKYALLDAKGTIVLPAEYDKLSFVKNEVIRAQKAGKWGLISTKNVVIAPFDNEEIGEILEGLCFFKKGGKWGIMNDKGKIILQPLLAAQAVGEFRDGLAWFGSNKFSDKNDALKRDFYTKNGYISADGKVIVKADYDFIGDFPKIYARKKGAAKVSKGNKYGFINEKGEEIIACQYDYIDNKFDSIYTHQNGAVQVRMGAKWGLINHEGKEILAPQFEELIGFEQAFGKKQSMFIVRNGELFGCANLSGNIVIPLTYKVARMSNLNDTLLFAKQGNYWGVISMSKKEILPFSFNAIRLVKLGNKTAFLVNKPLSSYSFFNENFEAMGFVVAQDCDYLSNNLIPFSNEKNLWGFTDKQGKVIFEPKFEGLKAFQSGLSPAKQGGKWGYINEKGEWKISAQFEEAFSFDKSFAVVKNAAGYGLIETNGKEILKSEHPKISYLGENLYAAANPEKGKKNMAIFCAGKLSKYDFSEIGQYKNGFISAKSVKENKFGYLNNKGEWAIQPQFLTANDFSDGIANVRLGATRVSFTDEKGNISLKAKYANASDFGNNRATADGQIIDKNGTVLAKYEGGLGMGAFSENAIVVSNLGYFHIDEKGNTLYENKFDSLTNFKNGLALAKIGEIWELEREFMDGSRNTIKFSRRGMEDYKKKYPERNKKAVKTNYDRFNDITWRKISDGKWKFINRAGKSVNEQIYDKASWHNGILKLQGEGLFGLMDLNGQNIIAPQFDLAKPIDENIIKFENPTAIFYYNVNGKWLWKD